MALFWLAGNQPQGDFRAAADPLPPARLLFISMQGGCRTAATAARPAGTLCFSF